MLKFLHSNIASKEILVEIRLAGINAPVPNKWKRPPGRPKGEFNHSGKAGGLRARRKDERMHAVDTTYNKV